MTRGPQFVYFLKPIGMDGPIKIGWSRSDPTKRIKAYLNWSPVRLELIVSIPGSYSLEQNIHECLATAHSHHEWFHATDAVRGLVEKLKAGVPIEEAIDLSKRTPLLKAKFGRVHTPAQRAHMSVTLRLRFAIKRYEAKHPGSYVRWRDDIGAIVTRTYKGEPLTEVDCVFALAPAAMWLAAQ